MAVESIDKHVANYLLPGEEGPLKELLIELAKETREGHLYLEIEGRIPEGVDQIDGVILQNGRLYFQRNFRRLQLIQERLVELLKETEAPNLTKPSELTDEQFEVVCEAFKRQLSIISGGPGTGKTYTAGHLVRILCESMDQPNIALAAPTGKAARRLMQSMASALPFAELRAMTMHALLGRDSHPLSEDIILIDESSMIDLEMMAKLLVKLKRSARLILLGDPDQLPPVEAGSLFSELVPFGGRLKRSIRAENQELIEAAAAVRDGKMPHFDEEKVEFVECAGNYADQERLIKEAVCYFPLHFSTIEEVMKKLDSFRILTPQHSGPFGTAALNRAIFETVAEGSHTTLALPIMITKNNYRQNLFNGECGVIMAPKSECQKVLSQGLPLAAMKEAIALFPGHDDHRRLPLHDLPPFDLAWAISIHKSQGSEYSQVLIALPPDSQLHGKELLYTALTRAKKSVQIWSTNEELNRSLNKTLLRKSGLLIANRLCT